MFSFEFCEISHDTFFKEAFGRLSLHEKSFCLLYYHDLLLFEKRGHIYFPAEYFLGLIYRLGTRVGSIFQTLSQKLEAHVQSSRASAIYFFCENSIFAKEPP